ncbi:hypothetical protein Tco_0724628 [Tanacetum coccineum]
MAKQQTIKYAPQWNNMTVDNVIFQTNNVVGNFNYPPNLPAYKPLMKLQQNCPLYNAFTNCPSMVYQNFLREFWSTSVAFDPFSSTDKPEKCPLMEFLIKFLVLNGQRPLTLDFNAFCSSTGLNYNNGKYVDHPTPEVLGRNYSSTKQVNSIQQLLAYSLITGTEIDIWEIIYSDLDSSKVTDIELTAHMIVVNNQRDSVSPPSLAAKPKKGKSQTGTIPDPQDLERDIQLASTRLPSTLDEGTRKSKPFPESTATHPKDSWGNKQPLDRDITSTTLDEDTAKTMPHPEGSLRDKDSGGNIPPADMKLIHTSVADPSGTGAKYQVDETQSTRLRYWSLTKNEGKTSSEMDPEKESDEEEVLAAGDDMDEDPQDDVEVRTLSPDQTQPEPSHASIKEYYEENIAHRDQIGQLVAASMSSLDKSSSFISDLYKGLNVIAKLLKDINNVVKDDPATNKKINESIKTFAKISTQTTEILSLVKTFDFSTLQSTMQDL